MIVVVIDVGVSSVVISVVVIVIIIIGFSVVVISVVVVVSERFTR